MITIPSVPTEEYSRNQKRCKAEVYPCVICGRPCPDPKWMLHLWDGTDVVTEDEAEKLDQAGDCGMYPVGSDCLKKHPELQPYAIEQK